MIKIFSTQVVTARNNFQIVSGHDDRPNSFLLGHVSFLADQPNNSWQTLECLYIVYQVHGCTTFNVYITHVAD